MNICPHKFVIISMFPKSIKYVEFWNAFIYHEFWTLHVNSHLKVPSIPVLEIKVPFFKIKKKANITKLRIVVVVDGWLIVYPGFVYLSVWVRNECISKCLLIYSVKVVGIKMGSLFCEAGPRMRVMEEAVGILVENWYMLLYRQWWSSPHVCALLDPFHTLKIVCTILFSLT